MTSKTAVVLALDTLGDLTLRQPLFKSLLDAGLAVTVVARRGYESILPFLDARLASLVLDCNPYAAPDAACWRELESLLRRITALDPSVVVCALYNRTYVDEWVCWRLPGVRTVGFAHPEGSPLALDRFLPKSNPRYPPGEWCFTEALQVPLESHECEKGNALVEAVLGKPLADYMPAIGLAPATEAASREHLAGLGLAAGQYVFGCPAGVAHVSRKAWPASDYVEAVAYLFERYGLRTLIAGLPAEDALLSRIVSLGSERNVPIVKWIGRPDTIGLLLGAIRHARLYLGNDSGPMHLAGALGVPVVAQFGGGTWPRFLPKARPAFVATQKVPCFGCLWDCWLDESVCITRVAPAKIREGIDWVLAVPGPELRIDPGGPPDALFPEMIARGASSRRAEVETLRGDLYYSQADREARLEVIEDLSKKLALSEAERAATRELVHEVERERARKAAENAELAARLAASEAASAAHRDAADRLGIRVRDIDADRAARLEHIRVLEHRLERMGTVRGSARIFVAGVLRKLGL